LDGQVARREDADLGKLLDQFVCVRVVQGWGMDLAVFQFDNDLTWAAFMMNADKTIYGRYGTKTGKDAMKDISLEGFRKALEGALDLHRAYPANKAALAGKTGPAPAWKTPETIPTMAGKFKQGDTSRWGCVHCHMTHEAEVLSLRSARQPVEDRLLWKYPAPEWLGLSLDPKERATVTAAAPGSPAAKAGFQPGDRIAALEGQPLVSIADVQWVLHHAKDGATLKAEVERAGSKTAVSLALPKDWRRAGTFVWPGHISAWMLQLGVPGFGAQALPLPEKKQAGLAESAFALKVQHVNAQDKAKSMAASQAGLQKNDVITAVDGKKDFAGESDYIAYLLQKKKPGEKVDLTVLRGGKPRQVTLTLP
jgi:hypothetical protein